MDNLFWKWTIVKLLSCEPLLSWSKRTVILNQVADITNGTNLESHEDSFPSFFLS